MPSTLGKRWEEAVEKHHLWKIFYLQKVVKELVSFTVGLVPSAGSGGIYVTMKSK